MVVQWAVAKPHGTSLENITAYHPVLTYWEKGPDDGHVARRGAVVPASATASATHRATTPTPTHHTQSPTYAAVGPGQYAQFRVTLTGLVPNSSYTFSVGWRNPPPTAVNGSTMMTPPATFHVPPVAEADLFDYAARPVSAPTCCLSPYTLLAEWCGGACPV